MSGLIFPISGPEILRNLEATHNLVRVDLQGREQFAYSLVLPKGWGNEAQLGEQTDAIGRLVRIGLFAERLGPGATVVQVFYSRMPVEVSIRDWLLQKAAEFSTEVTYCENVQFALGPVVDAGGLYGPENERQVIRLVAHADSARIFLVCAMTPLHRYHSEKNNIAIATNSFKLLRPTASTRLEQWLDTSGGNPSFHVSYPASWTSRPVRKRIEGKSGVDLLLLVEDQLCGYVRVKAIDPRHAPPPQGYEALKIAGEELDEGGISLVSSWEADQDSGIRAVEGLAFAYLARATLAQRPIELRFGEVRRGGTVFFLTTISVERQADPILWMRIKRAYEIALATVGPA